jgi:hypothetical protein
VPPPRTAPEVESAPIQSDPQAAGPHAEPPAPPGSGPSGATPHVAAIDAPGGATPDGLDEREREILAFERQWWRHAGAKEQAIRDRFGLSATRYYQLLNALLDNPAALAADPVLVGRLVRLRASRARNRRR